MKFSIRLFLLVMLCAASLASGAGLLVNTTNSVMIGRATNFGGGGVITGNLNPGLTVVGDANTSTLQIQTTNGNAYGIITAVAPQNGSPLPGNGSGLLIFPSPQGFNTGWAYVAGNFGIESMFQSDGGLFGSDGNGNATAVSFTGNGSGLKNSIGAPAAFWTDLTNEFGGWQVDARIGSDTTGFPSKTISNGVWLAANAYTNTGVPQLVVVHPGTYTENNLLSRGVNYFFQTGSLIQYFTPTTNDAGWGIFDDRAPQCAGGTTNFILGNVQLRFQTYTGLVFSASQGKLANQNFQGVIVCSNPVTRVKIEGDTISFSAFHSAGWIAAIADEGAAEMWVKFHSIYDPFAGKGVQPVMKLVSNGSIVNVASDGLGLVWVSGEMFNEIGTNSMPSYGIWGENSLNGGEGTSIINSTNPADFFYTGHSMASKIYMDNSTLTSTPNTADWRSWITVDVLENRFSQAGSCSLFGSGKHYLQFKKIESLVASSDVIDTSCVTNDSLNVWVNAQKITTGATATPWLVTAGGNVYVDALLFEDVSNFASPAGIWTKTNSAGLGSAVNNVNIRCASPIVLNNGNGIFHQSGTLRLNGVTVNTSTGPFSPVSVQSPGLILQNCVLVASNTVQSITNNTAETVAVYNGLMESMSNSANITINPGASTVITNSAVQ